MDLWTMITGNDEDAQSERTLSPASAPLRVANPTNCTKTTTVNKPDKKKRTRIPLLSGTQWSTLLELCYGRLKEDPENYSIRQFCQACCPQHMRRFYDAWKQAGLQALVEQDVPVTDLRVRKAIDLVAVQRTAAFAMKRKPTKQPPRELPKTTKKRGIPRGKTRGPYQKILTGREWAEYLENCYNYHLTATEKPTILAVCQEQCPDRQRTFYTVWNRSGLHEFVLERRPFQDPQVQARLQSFIEAHDYNLQLNKARSKQRRNRSTTTFPVAAVVPATTTPVDAAAAAAATISILVRQNASVIVDTTPIGIAVLIQTDYGDMLSAIKIDAEHFVLYEDKRFLKIRKADLLDDYRILGGGAAMHYPALVGGAANFLNAPLFAPQGTSVSYGDIMWLRANIGAFLCQG